MLVKCIIFFPCAHSPCSSIKNAQFYYTAAKPLKLPWNLLQIWVLQCLVGNNAKSMQEVGLINPFNDESRGGIPILEGLHHQGSPQAFLLSCLLHSGTTWWWLGYRLFQALMWCTWKKQKRASRELENQSLSLIILRSFFDLKILCWPKSLFFFHTMALVVLTCL